MHNFLKTLGLVSVLSAALTGLYGQENQDLKLGNGLYVLPTQLIFPELLLSYERFVKDGLSVTFSLGYKLPVGKGDTLRPFGHGLMAIYEYQYMLNEFSNGLYLGVAPSFYSKTNKTLFFSPEIFYRHYWFEDKKLFFDNEQGMRYNAIRTERNHVLGLKLLVGGNSKIVVSPKKAIGFKLYAGLSTRYKFYKYTNVDNVLEDGHLIPFEVKQGTAFWPAALHLGLKIGLCNLVPN